MSKCSGTAALRTRLAFVPDGDERGLAPRKLEVARHIRLHVQADLYDESRASLPGGIAIYSLSDPGDLRGLRYVGQTTSPKRRFLQHLNTARLWMPDERPWWVRNPKLRPLYEWIRAIYRQDARLPTMVIWEWLDDVGSARMAERARICEALANGLPLLNVEATRAAAQYQLL